MRTPLIKHEQVIKTARLLNMLYKPSEIAEELGVTTDTVLRSYIPAGLPCTKDDTRHLWIHGLTCAAWVRDMARQRRANRPKMPPGFGWCMKCNKAVEMPAALVTVRPATRHFEIMQAPCPHCNSTVNRARGVAK